MTRLRTLIRPGTGALFVALGLLTGCALNPSADTPRAEVDFPAPDAAWPADGTYPNLENLNRIAPGMTKDQLYALVGRPHFSTGLFDVRRWNYLFHLPAGQGSDRRCQYQVQYDGDMRVTRTLWRDAACETLLANALSSDAPTPAVVTRRSLDARTLFDFDSAQLTPAGEQQVRALARDVPADSNPRITVIGHTDPIGSDDYNMALSLRRAQSVQAALVAAGLSASTIESAGAGETRQVKSCANQASDAARRDCLQPNRRVEIQIQPGADTADVGNR